MGLRWKETGKARNGKEREREEEEKKGRGREGREERETTPQRVSFRFIFSPKLHFSSVNDDALKDGCGGNGEREGGRHRSTRAIGTGVRVHFSAGRLLTFARLPPPLATLPPKLTLKTKQPKRKKKVRKGRQKEEKKRRRQKYQSTY